MDAWTRNSGGSEGFWGILGCLDLMMVEHAATILGLLIVTPFKLHTVALPISMYYNSCIESLINNLQKEVAEPPPSKPVGDFAKVIITEIRPEANYKTLKITRFTTAFEVIVKCIQKYAMKEADEDPNLFYLTEVRILIAARCKHV
jgi:hypothetical protein